MEKLNGVYFQTDSNQYFLDTKSSEIFPINNRQRELLENIKLLTKDELYQELKTQYNSVNEYKKDYRYFESLIKKGYLYTMNNNGIPNYREEIKKATTSQLILVLTEQCNLRCKYCIYSDKYHKASDYSNKEMSLEMAKKSVDYYISIHKMKQEYGLKDKLQVNFYGGEPLLKFNLIKKIVDYIKSKNLPALYYITTNGVLLNDEISNFLVDNKFNVTFSVDGYKENHDRNRVTYENKNTFDDIMKNVTIYLKYRNEYSIKHKNEIGLVSFNCCYDYTTNLEKCIDFFANYMKGFSPLFIIYSQIDPYNTSYYDDYRMTDILTSPLAKSLDRIKIRFFSGECSKEFREAGYLLFTNLFTMYARNKNRESSFKGTCVPYSKLAVYPDGVITLCEKTGKRFPLGNINDGGVDEDELDKVLNIFFKNYTEGDCKNCEYQNLCAACYVQMNDDGTVNSEFCKNQKDSLNKTLIELYTLLETQPEMVKIIDASLNNREDRIR